MPPGRDAHASPSVPLPVQPRGPSVPPPCWGAPPLVLCAHPRASHSQNRGWGLLGHLSSVASDTGKGAAAAAPCPSVCQWCRGWGRERCQQPRGPLSTLVRICLQCLSCTGGSCGCVCPRWRWQRGERPHLRLLQHPGEPLAAGAPRCRSPPGLPRALHVWVCWEGTCIKVSALCPCVPPPACGPGDPGGSPGVPDVPSLCPLASSHRDRGREMMS